MDRDAIIQVRFKTTEEGGRQTGITGRVYPCPLLVDGEAFDCRIPLGNELIELGRTYELPVKFLFRDLAMPHLAVGKGIALWEGRQIADGKVLKLFPEA